MSAGHVLTRSGARVATGVAVVVVVSRGGAGAAGWSFNCDACADSGIHVYACMLTTRSLAEEHVSLREGEYVSPGEAGGVSVGIAA